MFVHPKATCRFDQTECPVSILIWWSRVKDVEKQTMDMFRRTPRSIDYYIYKLLVAVRNSIPGLARRRNVDANEILFKGNQEKDSQPAVAVSGRTISGHLLLN